MVTEEEWNSVTFGGLRPGKYLAPGEERKVRGPATIARRVKKSGIVYFSCSCNAWQKVVVTDKEPFRADWERTCPHLNMELGKAYQQARVDHFAEIKRAKSPQKSSLMESLLDSNPAYLAASTSSKRKKGTISDADASPPKRLTTEPAQASSSRSGSWVQQGKKVANQANKVMLASAYEKGVHRVIGWHVSEKLDGVRARWDGQQFWSRNGLPYSAPSSFTSCLPTDKDIQLDGELYIGRDTFDQVSGLSRQIEANDSRWDNTCFFVFDLIDYDLPFEQRFEEVQSILGKSPVTVDDVMSGSKKRGVWPLKHDIVTSEQQLEEKFQELLKIGGEGLMLRRPKSKYVNKKSGDLLKMKVWYDAEALVIGHKRGAGDGKWFNHTGSLFCEMADGKQFECGTGLTDALHRKPPPIGAIIKYKFNELTKDLTPRFPIFLGRVDPEISVPRDAEVLSTKYRKDMALAGLTAQDEKEGVVEDEGVGMDD